MKILSDNKEVHFAKSDFPILVSGRQGTGSSLFSVMLAVDAFRQGFKVLFFSAFHMAKDDLKKELSGEEMNDVEFVGENDAIQGKQMVVVNSGEVAMLAEILKKIPDIQERVVLIKNIDTYSEELFELVKDFSLLVLSGDLDATSFAKSVDFEKFSTKIFFSRPSSWVHADFPDPVKYTGMMFQGEEQSIVSLER